MILLLPLRCKRVLALPGTPVCPDLREHPGLLRMLVHLWLPLIRRWQELWRCVLMSACMGVGECVHPRVHVGACGRMFLWTCAWKHACVCLLLHRGLCVWTRFHGLSWCLKAGHCAAYRWGEMTVRGISVLHCNTTPCLQAQTSKNIIGLITTSCLYVGRKNIENPLIRWIVTVMSSNH